MSENTRGIEELRKKLLADVYSGSMARMPAMFLYESCIKNANSDNFKKIAKQYGY